MTVKLKGNLYVGPVYIFLIFDAVNSAVMALKQITQTPRGAVQPHASVMSNIKLKHQLATDGSEMFFISLPWLIAMEYRNHKIQTT